MGRRFENNKLKMAKSQALYAKKAAYIGKKVVIAVKAGGDDPSINRALAGVMREAQSLDVPKDVVRASARSAGPRERSRVLRFRCCTPPRPSPPLPRALSPPPDPAPSSLRRRSTATSSARPTR